MAYGIFHRGIQFGRSTVVSRDVKKRIVTKSILAMLGKQDSPLPGSLADERHGIFPVAKEYDDTLKPRGSILLWNLLQLLQELGVVFYIGTSATDPGISSGVNARFSIQGIHLDARIISDGRQRRCHTGVPCLDQCIFYETESRFRHIAYIEFRLRYKGYIFFAEYGTKLS